MWRGKPFHDVLALISSRRLVAVNRVTASTAMINIDKAQCRVSSKT